MELRSATDGVWNTGVGIRIGASTQSGSSSIWGIIAGSTPWNSEDFTGGGDEWGHTRVCRVPDWRRLDLLGRPEVKRPIVRSARGMELLPEEGAVDWWDIRIKIWQEPVWVYKFYQGWTNRVWRNRVGIELYSGVIPQVNFPWKITFDMLYTNKFLLGVRSRALAIPSEHTTI